MARILDLHLHSEASDDSRAPVEAYLKWLARTRDERPIAGLVLPEHRQFNAAADYHELEDKYGLLLLKASEVETDYGHMLVYGVNDEILKHFDFKNVHLDAQEVITEVARRGGIAMPCHPGRPTIGLIEHYQKRPPLEGVVGVEALNGGSKKGENERVAGLIQAYGYQAFGGSDSHLVSFVGICATEFERDLKTIEDLVDALRTGGYRPLDFRLQKPRTPITPEVLSHGSGL